MYTNHFIIHIFNNINNNIYNYISHVSDILIILTCRRMSGDGWSGEFLGAAARFARDRRAAGAAGAAGAAEPGWAAKYVQAPFRSFAKIIQDLNYSQLFSTQ